MPFTIGYGGSGADLPYVELLNRVAQRLGAETTEASARNRAIQERNNQLLAQAVTEATGNIAGAYNTLSLDRLRRARDMQDFEQRLVLQDRRAQAFEEQAYAREEAMLQRQTQLEAFKSLPDATKSEMMALDHQRMQVMNDDTLSEPERQSAMNQINAREQVLWETSRPQQSFQQQADQNKAVFQPAPGEFIILPEQNGGYTVLEGKEPKAQKAPNPMEAMLGPAATPLGIFSEKEYATFNELMDEYVEDHAQSVFGVEAAMLSPEQRDMLETAFQQDRMRRVANIRQMQGMFQPAEIATPPGANGQQQQQAPIPQAQVGGQTVTAADLAAPAPGSVFAGKGQGAAPPPPMYEPGKFNRPGEVFLGPDGNFYQVTIINGRKLYQRVQ